MAKTKEEIEKDELDAIGMAQNDAAKANIKAQKEKGEDLEKRIEEIKKESVVPVTDTTAKEDATYQQNLDLAAGAESVKSLGLGLGALSLGMTTDGHRSYHPNDVKFEVSYPKSYKGQRHMPEGITVVSSETAQQFTELGIGKIVK